MPTGLARLSTDAIRAELRRRERRIAPLQRRWARAAAKGRCRRPVPRPGIVTDREY